MADPIKVLGVESACNTTPSNFDLATLVRVINTGNTHALMTQKTAAGATKSTFTLGAAGSDASVEYVIKETTDTLSSNNDVTIFGVNVGYY